jgi:carbamoyl-phosphate synthase small subunit
MKAFLVLSDGKYFEGESFGVAGEAIGEVVFNTSMTGYQEILSDPSYTGQMVAMTCPHIGNYGVNEEDTESSKIYASGFIIRENSPVSSNWRSRNTLDGYLKSQNITGICGVDTRELTRHLRQYGAQNGIISTLTEDIESLKERAKKFPSMEGKDLVQDVCSSSAYEIPCEEADFKVAVYDYGTKSSILKNLLERRCHLKIFPARTPLHEVLSWNPQGLFLSNGPGDPAVLDYAISNIEKALGKIPIFGICLGHQLLALAMQGRTYKLKFGHHGANHQRWGVQESLPEDPR